MKRLVMASVVLGISGCAQPAAENKATATNSVEETGAVRFALADTQGRSVADASLEQAAGGVQISLTTTAMPAGRYGLHLHTVGRCDAPSFESAGAHWNPTAAQHGRDNPAGAHLGDLPNLEIGADGRGAVTYTLANAAMEGGANPLRDPDGTALVIHAAADDYKTDPSGNSGARIACGVVPK